MNLHGKGQATEKSPYDASNELYQALFEQAADGIFIADAQGKYVEVNRCGCEMLGYTREEILALSMADLIADEDVPLELDTLRASGTLFKERRLRCKDGRLLPVEISARVLADGRLLGLVRDISERKQVEQAYQRSNDLLQAIIQAAPVAITGLDLDGNVQLVWNPVAEKMLGWTADEVMGRPLPSVPVQNQEEFQRFRENIRSGKTLEGVEVRRQRRDGSPIDYSIYASPLHNAEGQITGNIAVLVDMTKRKEVEDELRRNRETAYHFSEQLSALQEVSIQLSKAESVDDLCQQAVQLGRSRLGFDRVGIWFIEEQRGIMRGSFGTDEHGNLRDERNEQVPFRHEGLAWRAFSRKDPTALVEYSTLYNHLGQPVGEGDNAMAALWDGDEVVGVISIDNFLTRQPITEHQLELLRLYATTVGHLITHKRVEEALRASEARFRTFVDHAADAFFLHDAEGAILDVNREACESLGYTREELIRMTPYDFDVGTDVSSIDQVRAQLDAGELLTFDTKHRRKDGHIFPVEVRVRPLWQGGRRYGVSLARNVTERKQAEKALLLFRSLIDLANDTIELIDPETGRFLDVNEQACLAHGYTREEFLALTVSDINPQVTAVTWENSMRELRQVGSRITESQHRRKDGSFFPVEVNITYTHLDRAYVLAVVRDITRRKQIERSLREREVQLQHIVDTVPAGVLLLDADGRIYLMNPVAEKYLAVLAPDQEDGRLEHGRLLCLGQQPLHELLTSPPPGLWHEITSSDFVFEAIARPVENSAQSGGWVLVLRDITQERDIQQRVQRQERLAAVGQLAAGIAHDFNNILAVITLYTQLISRTVDMPVHAQERMHTIEQQTKRAADLIQQILDFSRQSILERQPFDLSPFMEKLVTLLARTLPEHIQIDLVHTAESYFIQADISRIQQVIMNLAINARDAMPGGGYLRMRLAHLHTREARPLSLQELPPGDWVQIEVADSGGGIPAPVLPHIFEPFFTTKGVGQGTGLGLAQVYGIVQQHGGYIDVTTKVGQGTTFFLYFPALLVGRQRPAAPDKEAMRMGQGQRILLVEDNPTMREALRDSLTMLNYEVVTAVNGREALTYLETKADEVKLILSDTVMPEMGGAALYHTLRERNLTTPVVLLTGHPLSKEMEKLQALGLAGWLPKPPNLVTLSHLLAKILSE